VVTDYIAAKLPNRVLPVTKGADRVFSVRRRSPEDGSPEDWDADLFFDADIDKVNPTRVEAVVVDDIATVRLESTLCDQVKTGTAWRVLMSVDGLETPLLVGTFERNDGR
jgi:hypothetical protein